MRNAPERSNTRVPRAANSGASAADTVSGSARNTASVSRHEPIDVDRFNPRIPDAIEGGDALGFGPGRRHRQADIDVRVAGEAAA